jgi:uroporphyrinogen-III synthase
LAGNTQSFRKQWREGVQVSATIIITRPYDAAMRLATRLDGMVARGCTVIVSPVIEIAPVAATPPSKNVAGYIFTSTHGVTNCASFEIKDGASCWCVGAKTAQAARRAGFDVVTVAHDANSLAQTMQTQHPTGTLLYLRGRHVSSDLAAQLTSAGILCDEAVVYDQIAVPLSDAARRTLGGEEPVILPLYSPRSAALVMEQGPFKARILVAAISDVAAKAAKNLCPVTVKTARSPSGEAMRELIIQLAETVCPTPTPLEGRFGAG